VNRTKDNAYFVMQEMYPGSDVEFNDIMFPQVELNGTLFVNTKSDEDFLL